MTGISQRMHWTHAEKESCSSEANWDKSGIRRISGRMSIPYSKKSMYLFIVNQTVVELPIKTLCNGWVANFTRPVLFFKEIIQKEATNYQ